MISDLTSVLCSFPSGDTGESILDCRGLVTGLVRGDIIVRVSREESRPVIGELGVGELERETDGLDRLSGGLTASVGLTASDGLAASDKITASGMLGVSGFSGSGGWGTVTVATDSACLTFFSLLDVISFTDSDSVLFVSRFCTSGFSLSSGDDRGTAEVGDSESPHSSGKTNGYNTFR